MNKPYTQAEVDLLSSCLSTSMIAKTLGRSITAVQHKRAALGIHPTASVPQAADSSVTEDLAEKDEAYWSQEHSDLSKKYHRLLKEQTVVERLVQRIESIAPVGYSPAPAIRKGPSRQRHGRGQSAVLMFSDTHIGKNTSPTQTLSFGSYNFETFMARLKYLEESVLSITENHVSTEVPELVIAMLGDMLDGQLVHSNEVGQLDPIFNQFYCGAHAIAQFLRNLAPHFPVH
jgi:hypothetical protein